ncbi:haloacid dehalogenase type II [Streptomyces sp. MK5]|uniref:haloacid dehalogenase type II n=1 Tax=Streptomyces sp. MK5 TaxID=3064253 RepID=UPI00274186BA|nr:haloacid dehalogenase type II [Streptomyces sp. MK5]
MLAHSPAVLVFDVNETLSDFAALRQRFNDVGAEDDLVPLWFAAVLRDGFAITAAGGYADFADIARDNLRQLLSGAPWEHDRLESAISHVMSGFAELDVHQDVPDGVRTLHAAGFRLVTMTNGSAPLTERLLTRAGVRGCFGELWDVTGPRRWKPHPRAYRYATERAGVRPDEAMLVATHPWDVDGAQRAGLRGAWLRRGTATGAYPRSMTAPALQAEDMRELALLLR